MTVKLNTIKVQTGKTTAIRRIAIGLYIRVATGHWAMAPTPPFLPPSRPSPPPFPWRWPIKIYENNNSVFLFTTNTMEVIKVVDSDY